MIEWKKNALYDKQWNAFLGQQEYLLHDIALWKELSEQDIYCYSLDCDMTVQYFFRESIHNLCLAVISLFLVYIG